MTLLLGGTSSDSLQDPFTDVLDKLNITDPFVRNWLNLLCFLLQGLPSDGTTTAVMSYMIADWCRPVRRTRRKQIIIDDNPITYASLLLSAQSALRPRQESHIASVCWSVCMKRPRVHESEATSKEVLGILRILLYCY